jgi:RNA polymerase sigma-70 factor (ECF subfamily)
VKISANNQERAANDVGEPASFEEVYAAYFPFVWRCLRTLGIPSEGRDDAAQDVFVVVHRRMGGFRGQSSLKTWLYGIVRNVASNHRRTIHRKGAPATPSGDEAAHPAAGPVERAQDAEAAAFVESFLATLGPSHRDVFVLGVIEEMSGPEVAAALSIPLNTAYTRLRAARADFERALRAEEDRDD